FLDIEGWLLWIGFYPDGVVFMRLVLMGITILYHDGGKFVKRGYDVVYDGGKEIKISQMDTDISYLSFVQCERIYKRLRIRCIC
ncbi:unnamed protein product, partial [Linum tenue]